MFCTLFDDIFSIIYVNQKKKNVLHSIEAYKAMIKAEVLLEVIRIRVFRMHCEVR